MKLLVHEAAVGARHAVPLQLRRHRNTSVFIEFPRDLRAIREKSGLVLPSRRFFLLLFALFAQHCLARQANLVALDSQHLDEHLVAEL